MSFSYRVFADVSERDFNEYIGRINKEFDFVQFEAQTGKNQYDSEIYYGVVNKVFDEHAKTVYGFNLLEAEWCERCL